MLVLDLFVLDPDTTLNAHDETQSCAAKLIDRSGIRRYFHFPVQKYF